MTHIFNWVFIDQPVWISNASNLTSITVLSIVLAALKHFNCQSSKKVTGERCWRIATHPVPGTTYRTCHKHMDHAEVLRVDHAQRRPRAHAHLTAVSAASNADSGSPGPTNGESGAAQP